MIDNDTRSFVRSAREKFNDSCALTGEARESMLFMSLGDCILALESIVGEGPGADNYGRDAVGVPND